MDSDWITVAVDDGSFLLSDAGGIAPGTLDFTTGLIATMDIGAMISAGIHTGPVRVHAHPSPERPEDDDLSAWDEICEASVYAPAGDLRVTSHYEGNRADLPLLSPQGPGWYRARARARGRDTAHDAVQETPVEDYQLTCWPAPPTTPLIMRATDAVGRGLRSNTVKPVQPPPASIRNPPTAEERRATHAGRTSGKRAKAVDLSEWPRTPTDLRISGGFLPV